MILIGRLTRKPELNHTPNQNTVTRFSLAVDRGKSDAGADFPTIVAWNKTAENVCRFKDKGDQIAVMGRIQTGSYKKGDETIYTTEVVADRVEFIGSKEPKAEPTVEPQAEQVAQDAMSMFGIGATIEGIPF